MEVAGKNILVVGVARSGVAVARLLAARGARVTANDAKDESQLAREADELRPAGVRLALGGHPDELFAGADLVVLSPGVPADLPQLGLARGRGAEIISEPELAGRFLRGRMIGITGSNGKTTTTALTGELMKAAGARVIVGGNIGTPLTSLIEQSDDETWTVAELSSFQLEMIDSLRAHVAVVTNITPDHLDRHGTFENYVAAKHRIFRNQTADDFAVLNGRDRAIDEMAKARGVPSRKVYFSSQGPATVSGPAADIYVRDGRLFTTLLADRRGEAGVMAVADVPLRGMHNVENVMAGLAAVFCAMRTRADDLPALVAAIKQFPGVEHRIEYVTEIDGVKFYNDSKATNVDSTVKALEAFDRDLIVILGGKDKGSDYAILAPLVSRRVKQVVLLGAASDKIAAQLDGVRPIARAASMRDAVHQSMAAAEAGDTVLLAPACASFDMFDNYEHRGRVFKQEVMNLAARRQEGVE
jgi:UDP-N-acetylmuramoylalanine--D-glutamate ligase